MDKTEIMEKINSLKKDLLTVKGTPCEVYSRVVGYFRPVKQWNGGKTEEFHERVAYGVNKLIKEDKKLVKRIC